MRVFSRISLAVFVAANSGLAGAPDAAGTNQTSMLRIVALGDSTTAGTPAWKSPNRIATAMGAATRPASTRYWLMQSHPEWEVLNRGVNGERSDQIAARFERDVIEATPKAVVIIAGVNDVYQGRSVEHVTAELARMTHAPRAPAF